MQNEEPRFKSNKLLLEERAAAFGAMDAYWKQMHFKQDISEAEVEEYRRLVIAWHEAEKALEKRTTAEAKLHSVANSGNQAFHNAMANSDPMEVPYTQPRRQSSQSDGTWDF